MLKTALAEESAISFLLTSNLNGRFTPSVTNQETEDPMLIMAQSLIAEQKNHPADLYADLGNAFCPGILSRFSFGSVMMDFLEHFNCAVTLVSSQDLDIGISNLEFLNKKKQTVLLSANIEKFGEPVFIPYFIQKIKGKKIAFIGISSEKGSVDIAEKKLFKIGIKNYGPVIENTLEQLRKKGVDDIVLLSGASYEDNVAMMEQFKDISLCISGGDATGQIYSVKVERMDIDEGRSIVTLTRPNGFYTLTLLPEKHLAVDDLIYHEIKCQPARDARYTDFVKRLTIWKNRYAHVGQNEIVKRFPRDVRVDDKRVANLLRHRFQTEVAIMEKNAILPHQICGKVDYSSILGAIDDQYPIFTYKITGKELSTIYVKEKNLVFTGTDGRNVQGCLIDGKRKYLICSTQSVYDRLAKRIGRKIKYTNSWRTISDEMETDLKNDQVIGYRDFGYLDMRFRTLVDIYLSNFYDRSDITQDENMDTPVGKPASTYEKWGIEDEITITFYNRYHKFEITPYIYFIRQDETYYQNLLRGTLFYTYNLNPLLKPYFKSQVETVVKKVDNRPFLFRETLGVFIESKHVTGKMGAGFEKQTHSEEDMLGGLETILGVKYDLTASLTCTFDLDTFYSVFSGDQFRGELTYAFYFKLNSFMSFSPKYKWFYYRSLKSGDSYRNEQILLSLDLKTNFKKF